MQLVDRNEKRRFVGREFLLWLWFESEIFEATLSTQKQGSFGLWIDRLLVLSVGKEVTRIKGAMPARSREAKEALAVGKLPETASFHLSLGDREFGFTLKAERMALTGLSLPTALGKEDDAPILLEDRPPPPKKKKKGSAEDERERDSDERHESFYERMHLAREVEALVEALYREFLAIRLSEFWHQGVVPTLASWVLGDEVEVDEYREARERALSQETRRARRSEVQVATQSGRAAVRRGA